MTSFNFINFLAILSFLLLSCQPMELKYASVEPVQPDSGLYGSSLNKDTANSIPTRSSQQEFKEHFLSNKLDLVFIMDTSPGMESFYQSNSFGENFLSQFQNYDWKLAYTDMSVDVQTIIEQEEKAKKEKKSCNFLAGLAMTIGGLFIGSGSELLFMFGVKDLKKCSFKNSDTEKISYANGAFLPFEYNSSKVPKQAFYQITKETPNYNTIFDHTVKLNKASKNKKNSYSAPILRQTESYPFLSMALSMAGALNTKPSSSENNGETLSFFREDSLIVYVLITVQDLKVTLPPEKFIDSIESSLGSKQRFKLIPVTLTGDSSLFCNLKLQKNSTESEKLHKLAKSLNYHSLDICSKLLGERIFNEISKNLYSKGLFEASDIDPISQ